MLESHSISGDSSFGATKVWFVYLLPLLDYSAFKVGFSCNPLQRIYSFNRRYYERFDLPQSLLLQLDARKYARAIETSLKSAFAEFRADCPLWVEGAAGGHTEWFSAIHFANAEERLRSFLSLHDSARLISATDFIRSALNRLSTTFEPWAMQQAQRLRDDLLSVTLGYEPTESANLLRDWVDAYRFFDVQLFKDDPSALKFVMESAQLSDLR